MLEKMCDISSYNRSENFSLFMQHLGSHRELSVARVKIVLFIRTTANCKTVCIWSAARSCDNGIFHLFSISCYCTKYMYDVKI